MNHAIIDVHRLAACALIRTRAELTGKLTGDEDGNTRGLTFNTFSDASARSELVRRNDIWQATNNDIRKSNQHLH
jgi:hypothetical protein